MSSRCLNIRATKAPSFQPLISAGYSINHVFLGDYFDGLNARKVVHGCVVDVYVGSDNGTLFFAPQCYVDGKHIGEAECPEKAARIGEFRALLNSKRACDAQVSA